MTKIREISQRLVDLLELDIEAGTPIYIGKSNAIHMSQKHNADYRAFRKHLPEILLKPDYVGINPNDEPVEYVKIFENNGVFVKVAVRISHGNVCYARTIYSRDLAKLTPLVSSGHLIKY